INKDSVFRLASVSKVLSVWSFLIEVGDEHFNDPITRYVPELGAVSNISATGVVYDDIDQVRWNEVTLGQLASHLAGIPRDPAQTDMSAELVPQQAIALGLPPLSEDEIPKCGVTGLLRTCSRSGRSEEFFFLSSLTTAEMISQLLKQHPIFPTGHSPAYTNMAYALLGFAQEAITGTPVSEAITSNILFALNMTSSSFSRKPDSGGVIPGNESVVGWDWDMGTISPSGSLYASTADMVKAGRAILGSKTMTPAQTRRWLQPMSQTGVLGSAVGAPWEIRHLMIGGRLTQLYTKQGDTGGYRAALILSPEHDIGAVIFSAGPIESNSAAVRETLMNAVGKAVLPMAETQARVEARDKFTGTFTDETTNSSVTIEVDHAVPGLVVKHLFSQGVEVIGPSSPFIQIYGAGQSARLFLTSLKTLRNTEDGKDTYESRLGFRATFSMLQAQWTRYKTRV
ncbi:beta-lactamase/transpeptidase-like protein, partial [Stachybotrys elegans]